MIAAIEIEMENAEVGQRRRANTQADHVEPPFAHAADQCRRHSCRWTGGNRGLRIP